MIMLRNNCTAFRAGKAAQEEGPEDSGAAKHGQSCPEEPVRAQVPERDEVLTGSKYQPNFNLILDVPPEKQEGYVRIGHLQKIRLSFICICFFIDANLNEFLSDKLLYTAKLWFPAETGRKKMPKHLHRLGGVTRILCTRSTRPSQLSGQWDLYQSLPVLPSFGFYRLI